MDNIIVTTIKTGQASVRDRETGRNIGHVSRIQWPRQVGGIVEITERWEARRPHEMLTVNPFGFPTAGTRREAAALLASRG